MTYSKHHHKHAQTATHNWSGDPVFDPLMRKTGESHCKRCGARRRRIPLGEDFAADVSPFRYFLPGSKAEYGKRPACLRKPAKVQEKKWHPGRTRRRGTRLLSNEEIRRDAGFLPARIGVY